MIQFTKSRHQLLCVQLRCLDSTCMKPNIQGHTAAPRVLTQAWEEVMDSYITQSQSDTQLPSKPWPPSSADEEWPMTEHQSQQPDTKQVAKQAAVFKEEGGRAVCLCT